mgnify:CR=1 FL=1
MESKISIQDLSAILTKKRGLKRRDAEAFVQTMFEVVKDGLVSDRLVKVKGLGTFKVIDVDDRECIDVNTGERVLIEGHEKLTFTADATMKELVNKPFSQFDTVILNEGVNFDDMEPDIIAEPALDEEEEVLTETEPELEPLEEVEPVPVAGPKPLLAVVEEAEQEEEPLSAAVEEPETGGEQETELENESQTENNKKESWIISYIRKTKRYFTMKRMLLIAALSCIIGIGGGFYIGHQTKPEAVAPVVLQVAPETEKELAADNAVKSTVEDKAEKPVEANGEAMDELKINTDDPQLRLGAYDIVGVQTVVAVQAGDDLESISRRWLGPDMECYVRAINDLDWSQLKEGQEVRIPKVKIKSKNKNKN